MATTRSLRIDALGPESYVRELVPDDVAPGFDLSTVTAAELQLEDERGEIKTVPAVRSNQTTTTLTLTRVLAAGDLGDLPGLRIVRPKLTVGADTRYAAPRKLLVQPAFA